MQRARGGGGCQHASRNKKRAILFNLLADDSGSSERGRRISCEHGEIEERRLAP